MFAKLIRPFMVAIILLVITALGAVPANAANPEVTFAGREFFYGKGVVFYFNVDPGYDVDGAVKYAVIDGVQYELTCRLRQDGLLACLADAPQTVIGEIAEVHFGPYEFETIIPEERVRPGAEFCYALYSSTGGPWNQVGTHCQSFEAADGDAINAYNSDVSANTEFDFLSSGPNGPGYYYFNSIPT